MASRWDFVEVDHKKSRAEEAKASAKNWRTARRGDSKSFTVVKTVTGHTGMARFLAECEETGLFIANVGDVPSPYSYAPRWPVLKWRGKNVFVREIYHGKHKVISIPAGIELLTTDSDF